MGTLGRALPCDVTQYGQWMLMAHASLSAQYTKATGPLGSDKTYATSMAMLMAQRDTSWGRSSWRWAAH